MKKLERHAQIILLLTPLYLYIHPHSPQPQLLIFHIYAIRPIKKTNEPGNGKAIFMNT